MKIVRWLALLAGLVVFALSFKMVAVKDSSSKTSSGIMGYNCATISLSAPWGGSDSVKMRRETPALWFSLLFSGWINPAFGLGLIITFLAPKKVWTLVLRCVIAVMFVSCWVFFHQMGIVNHVYLVPVQGFYTWMAGILVALFSNPRGAA